MASYPATPHRILDPADLRATFDAVAPLTLGIEEEAMLLDERSLALLARAPEVIDELGGDPRFKLELPASQLEIVLAPTATVAESTAGLATARRELARAAEGVGRLASAVAAPGCPEHGRAARGDGPRVRGRGGAADGLRAAGPRRRGRPRAHAERL
jgi:carboxylate-amine ligase